MSEVKTITEKHLVQRSERLEKKIQSLSVLSQRFSLIRMTLFGVGAILTWIASATLGSWAGWLAFASGLTVFLVVVLLHQRLENWIQKFKYWQHLYKQQLARYQLDWQGFAYRSLPETFLRSPLDIDLDLTGLRSLHHLIDQSISEQGSLRLANWLSNPKPDVDEIHKRQNWVRELMETPRFGMRLQLVFQLASRERIKGDQLIAWLKVDFDPSKLKWSLPVASILALTTLGLFIGNATNGIPAFWVISALLYLTFYNFTGRSNMEVLEQVAILDAEIGKLRSVFGYLEKVNYQRMPAIKDLCQPFVQPGRSPSVILRRLKWVTAAVGLRMNPVMGLLLNIFLPWDYFWAYLAIRFRRRLAIQLPLWLDRLYQLETLVSLADYCRNQAGSSFPVINEQLPVLFEAEQLAHPLLAPQTRVANDFSLNHPGEVALITGSNMAGKSTFIKTVGINLCLAYAGATVLARNLRSRPLRLHSCIRISDSISDGFSYFYAEVKCLGSLLEKLKSTNAEGETSYHVLYLIDEIFRGTNNRERLIGSQAYLRAALQGNGAGIVATHDLELASLAEQSPMVNNYHFRDRVEDGRLVFDYVMREGASPTTNALRIMAMEGLPINPQGDQSFN